MKTDDRHPSSSITADSRFGLYVDAFQNSSSHVRYAAILTVVASSVLLAACWNSLRNSWVHSRLKMTQEALVLAEWCSDHSKVGSWGDRLFAPQECPPSFETDNRVFKNLRSKDVIRQRLTALEDAYAHKVLLVGLPISGPVFEINDLGAFTGIILTFIMLYLCLTVVHNYETLFLTLWKVFKIAEIENRPDKGDSDANLLYHALAIRAVFSTPPTLARWKPGPFTRHSPKIFFLLPLAVHSLVVVHNYLTSHIAEAYRPGYPKTGIVVQIVTLAFLVILSGISVIYARGSDKRWAKAFSTINPTRYASPPAGWEYHVGLRSWKTKDIYQDLSIPSEGEISSAEEGRNGKDYAREGDQR